MIVLIGVLGFCLALVVNLLSDSLPYFRRPRIFHCHSCGKQRELIAWSGILGFLMGRRKCPHCHTPRPLRAVVVEILLPLVAIVLYRSEPALGAFLPSLFITTIFTLIAVIDIEHRLILHIVSFPSAVVVGLIGILDPNRGVSKTLIGGLVGFGIFLLLYFLGHGFALLMAKLRGSEIEEVAFGFGDVTLAGVIGLTVGWSGVLLALVLGILAAGLFSFLYIAGMALRRKYNPFMPIPYGPFMILGCLVTYFGGRDLFTALIT